MKLFGTPCLFGWLVLLALVLLANVLPGCLSGVDDEQLGDLEFDTAALSVAAVDNDNPPQCQVTDATIFLAGGSMSFGACQGECQFTFETQMSDDGGCATANLNVCGWGVAGCTRSNSGTFTPRGAARLQQIAVGLSEQQLKRIYGCPGCTDGGTSQLRFVMDDEPIIISYEHGNPPELLEEADGFSNSVITALNTCVSNENIEISSTACSPAAN